MDGKIILSEKEYNSLKTKAQFFDELAEDDDLSTSEKKRIKKASRGPFMSKDTFLKDNVDLI